MAKLKIVLSFVILLFCAAGLNAQKVDHDSIWKRHKKWTTVAYEIQNMKSGGKSIKSDYAFVLTSGNTFYLHKEPIAGLMKFGLDWRHIDVAFANYGKMDLDFGELEDSEEVGDMPDLSRMKVEIGMGIGPSFTVNPVDYLKTGVYFHVTPSYSLVFNEGGLFANYATFFNTGLHVSYKAASVGFEYRWCGDTKYKTLMGGEEADEEEMGDSSYSPLISTNSIRLCLSLRFGGKRYKK